LEDKLNYTCKEVYGNAEISDNIYQLEVSGSFRGNPGQFYMLRCWEKEPVLSRPISIHALEKNKITFLYRVIGNGTKKLCNLKRGDKINLLGPLGNGFNMKKLEGNIAVITGGIGIAPMFYLVVDMINHNLISSENRKNLKVDLYAGFKDEIYSVEKFRSLVDNVYITTESGKYGKRGFVTEGFKPEFYDMVLCCGPEVMMKKVAEGCVRKKVAVYMSMERRMACGIGACLGCACNTIFGNKRVCKDGPVFSGRELVW
jgi:dihydroorotate dehydrogenase electron transfer subunit